MALLCFLTAAQGPEWVWPLGYYLRARLAFFGKVQSNVNLLVSPLTCLPWSQEPQHCPAVALAPHRAHLRGSLWAGLPELTNDRGAVCADACPTQAWSMATLLDFVYDYERHP